ncbi:hypothetical protein Hanom_Chr10g00915771 [Helianthus anomalus]
MAIHFLMVNYSLCLIKRNYLIRFCVSMCTRIRVHYQKNDMFFEDIRLTHLEYDRMSRLPFSSHICLI